MTEKDINIIRLNRLVVVESLTPEDKKTASDMVFDLNLDIAQTNLKAKFELCRGVDDFRRLILELTAETLRNEVLPLLHVECHGDPDDGLLFNDGQMLSWLEFWNILRPLNEAMGLRLVVVLATCLSATSVVSLPLHLPAPCYFLIAPTKNTYPQELYEAFKEFYQQLALGDSASAMESLTSRSYQEGEMMPISASHWFDLLMESYLREHGTVKGLKAASLRLYLRAKAENLSHFDLRYWKNFVRSTLAERLHKYFDTFFMLDRFPGARLRFVKEQKHLETMLKEFGYPGSVRG